MVTRPAQAATVTGRRARGILPACLLAVCFCWILLPVARRCLAATDVIRIPAAQPQLFLDDALIAENSNVKRHWHPWRKHPSNPLILKSGAEEGLYLFGTVLREPDPRYGGEPVFRMWYSSVRGGKQLVAYATSRDGLHWEKPELGIVEIGGSRANNAMVSVPCAEAGVIRDPRPDAPPDDRYKMVAPTTLENPRRKVHRLITSPDGIDWKQVGQFVLDKPCKPDRTCLVWDPYRELFALYTRAKYDPPELVRRGGPAYWGRAVALCTSKDFKTWSGPTMVVHAEPDDPDGTEVYSMMAFPYGGQWVGLPQIHRSLPELGYIDIAVAHSRDGIAWKREKTLVLASGGPGEWDRFNQACATAPIRVGDELWLYYSGRLYRHGEYKRSGLKDSGPYHIGIGLATLRLDGFCSLEASFDGGQITTRPLLLPQGRLLLNAKSDWGTIVVELLDPNGNSIPAMRSAELTADGVSLPVRWPEGKSLSEHAGKPVRLRFTLNNARLFSWRVDQQ